MYVYACACFDAENVCVYSCLVCVCVCMCVLRYAVADMMYGFGDLERPRPETISVMEEIVYEYIEELVCTYI